MTLKMPESIKSNDFKSAKWDEITKGRSFKESDIPTLELPCQWHLVCLFWCSGILTGSQTETAYKTVAYCQCKDVG